MIVGYNYPAPCNKDGNWIGPPDRQDHWPPTYATLWKELPLKKQIAENLKTLRDNGVQVVRWFLLGNGFNYGWPPRVVSIRKRDKFDSPYRLSTLILQIDSARYFSIIFNNCWSCTRP